MLGQATLERYLEEVQRLSQAVAAGDKNMSDLQGLINLELSEAGDDQARRALLLGERAFYQRQYKLALKHYMDAKALPLFQFFCYRACAFLFDQEKKTEKAIDFASKALTLVSSDWTTVALYSALLANAGRHEDAKTWHNKLQPYTETSAQDTTASSLEEGSPSAVMLGAEEFDELTQLFEEHQESTDTPSSPTLPEPSFSYIQESVTKEPTRISRDGDQGLEQRIHAYQELQKRALREYLNLTTKKLSHQDYLFHVLDGWSDLQASDQGQLPTLLSQGPRQITNGYFLKWSGKGVAINPGRNFLQTLHRQGSHIRDIDFVVVTKSAPEAYFDVKAIYDLNAKANAGQENLHIIHYYLHQPAYQELSRLLKPLFKQERQTVHCLDLYLDSPNSEAVTLIEGIELHYFSTSRQNQKEQIYPPALGIRLDLIGPAHGHEQEIHPVRVGYLSGAPWSPFLAEHLVGCDLLIAGIEETSPEDSRRTRYNTHSLGYFGTLSLLEEVVPRLLLCCEFTGAEGDVRIELARKLRADACPEQHSRRTTILPGDVGLTIDLTTLQVRCNATRTFVDPSQIHVVRTDEHFSSLKYLAPQSVL